MLRSCPVVCCFIWCLVCALDLFEAAVLPCIGHMSSSFSDDVVPAISDLLTCDLVALQKKHCLWICVCYFCNATNMSALCWALSLRQAQSAEASGQCAHPHQLGHQDDNSSSSSDSLSSSCTDDDSDYCSTDAAAAVTSSAVTVNCDKVTWQRQSSSTASTYTYAYR